MVKRTESICTVLYYIYKYNFRIQLYTDLTKKYSIHIISILSNCFFLQKMFYQVEGKIEYAELETGRYVYGRARKPKLFWFYSWSRDSQHLIVSGSWYCQIQTTWLIMFFGDIHIFSINFCIFILIFNFIILISIIFSIFILIFTFYLFINLFNFNNNLILNILYILFIYYLFYLLFFNITLIIIFISWIYIFIWFFLI